MAKKTIFNMADGIITPCNVARSWHWFRQVTDCTLQCGMWLWNHDRNSPTCSTLQCDTWRWDDIRWIRAVAAPAMWHIALGSWHWIRQVAAPCNVACGSEMTCHEIRQNVRHIGILHLVPILTISPQSTCHSAPVCDILSKSDHN